MLDSPFTAEPEVELPSCGLGPHLGPALGDADPADQLAELAGAVADMVGGVHRAVLAFSGGGARTAMGTAAVSSRVHHIRTELEGVAVAVEALHSGAEDAALAGEQSARMCGDLAAEVERGSAVLARVVEAVEAMGAQRERIERLADQLAEIATFSGVIKEVADKTKLLALNATIEAARAGTHGAAFRVVADEIGKLAADSEAQTRRIAAVVAATHSDLDPLREAIDAGRAHGDGVADAHDARETAAPHRRARRAAHRAGRARRRRRRGAAAGAGRDGRPHAGQRRRRDGGRRARHADERTGARPVVLGRGRLRPAAPVLDRLVRRPRRRGRRVAWPTRSAPSSRRLVDSGRISLAQVLDPRYEEITGARIASLGRLFDVSRVPLAGFDPPKFSTAYDALIDEPLMALYDRTLAENPWLALAAGSDLNVYAPAHARRLCDDWTGDPRQDLIGNRIKRLLTDNPALVRANRVGIGGRDLPHRPLTRSEFRTAGCDLTQPPGGEQRRLVQTYARDTGAIFTVLSVPVYVHGERWGASVIGWDPDTVGT